MVRSRPTMRMSIRMHSPRPSPRSSRPRRRALRSGWRRSRNISRACGGWRRWWLWRGAAGGSRRPAGRAPLVVVEGAGGWLAPLDGKRSMADIAVTLRLPVILVVGMRLGCLNHALLTAAAISRAGAPLAGWVANRIDPAMAMFEENLAALQERLGAPPLVCLPHLEDEAAAA